MQNNENTENQELAEDASSYSMDLVQQSELAESPALESIQEHSPERVMVPDSEQEKADQPKIEHRILIVHDKDQDGYCAANIVKQYKKQPTVAVGMVAWGHSKDLRSLVIDPDKWDEIFIVDLATPLTYIKDLLLNGFKVTVIDHHDTTIEAITDFVDENFCGVVGKDKSAAGLTWTFLHGEATPMPWTVQMINNWDLWNHEDPQVIPFHYGMECINVEDTNIWRQLIKGDPSSCSQIMQMGQMVGAYWINEMNDTTKDHHYVIEKNGIRFMCCNGWFTSSYDFASGFNPEKHDAIMWFRYAPAQGITPWRLSFRTTKEGINLLQFGKGHTTSCGVNLTTEEMKEWFPSDLNNANENTMETTTND